MILGSHNSWSYLPPKTWYMKLFNFVSKCQDWDIKTQYEHGVRCFDLRIKYNGMTLQVVHGCTIYDISVADLLKDLEWLNTKGDVYVRVLHEVRKKSQYTERSVQYFKDDCAAFEQLYPNIKFWCGRNLYNWEIDYEFKNKPSCAEYYSSVVPPKIDDVCPRYYAKKNNKVIYQRGTDKDILLIDFVNYVV